MSYGKGEQVLVMLWKSDPVYYQCSSPAVRECRLLTESVQLLKGYSTFFWK